MDGRSDGWLDGWMLIDSIVQVQVDPLRWTDRQARMDGQMDRWVID